MKKFLSFALVLCLSTAMTVTAMASNPNTQPNVNADGTEVTLPGAGAYTTPDQQVAGESYGFSTMTTDDGGSTWNSENDDDALDSAQDTNGTDIYVWAKVTNDGSSIYKIDIAWGAMKFEFSGGGATWNVNTHEYEGDTSGSGTAEWVVPDYLDNINNKIEVTNHSNQGVTAQFTYTMDGATPGGNTMFNDAWDGNADSVVGGFYASNTDAQTAALELTGIHASGTVNNAGILAAQLKNKIWDNDANDYVDDVVNTIDLPTAWYFNTGGNDWQVANDKTGIDFSNTAYDVANGARTKTINFAFSGTPDTGRGAVLDTFRKVGVITVTVEPNLDVALNSAYAGTIPTP